MNLQNYNFRTLMSEALSHVPNTVDKNEGSIIYDALAPACYILAQYYIDLQNVLETQFIQTSYGEYLDKLANQSGVYRKAATKAVKQGSFRNSQNELFNVSIGDRFSTEETNPLNYIVISKISDGEFRLQCETEGTVGNSYTGTLIPISYINGLATATLGNSLTLGSDTETDDSVKKRYIALMNEQPFGGNVSDYVSLMKKQSGVGDVQVYPIWDGGGTVKVSVVDSNYDPVSSSVIDELQTTIDPITNSGEGLGLAPIGHSVTITTPTELILNITASITVETGTTIEQYQTDTEEAIGIYINSIREEWGNSVSNSYVKTIYNSQILSSILNVEGVENATDILINTSASDIVLVESGTTQQIPKLGTVTLSEIS